MLTDHNSNCNLVNINKHIETRLAYNLLQNNYFLFSALDNIFRLIRIYSLSMEFDLKNGDINLGKGSVNECFRVYLKGIIDENVNIVYIGGNTNYIEGDGGVGAKFNFIDYRTFVTKNNLADLLTGFDAGVAIGKTPPFFDTFEIVSKVNLLTLYMDFIAFCIWGDNDKKVSFIHSKQEDLTQSEQYKWERFKVIMAARGNRLKTHAKETRITPYFGSTETIVGMSDIVDFAHNIGQKKQWVHSGLYHCNLNPQSTTYSRHVTEHEIPYQCGISGSSFSYFWEVMMIPFYSNNTQEHFDTKELGIFILTVFCMMILDGGHSLMEVIYGFVMCNMTDISFDNHAGKTLAASFDPIPDDIDRMVTDNKFITDYTLFQEMLDFYDANNVMDVDKGDNFTILFNAINSDEINHVVELSTTQTDEFIRKHCKQN